MTGRPQPLKTAQARQFVDLLGKRDLNLRRIPNIQAQIDEVQRRKTQINADLKELIGDLELTPAQFHVDGDVNKPWLPYRTNDDSPDQIQVVADHLGVDRSEIDNEQ